MTVSGGDRSLTEPAAGVSMSNQRTFPVIAFSFCGLLLADPRTPGDAASLVQSPGPGSVVINEVAWGGTAANFSHEWIELYNTTAETISLNGWQLLPPTLVWDAGNLP